MANLLKTRSIYSTGSMNIQFVKMKDIDKLKDGNCIVKGVDVLVVDYIVKVTRYTHKCPLDG